MRTHAAATTIMELTYKAGAGYNARASHRKESGFVTQMTAYNKGYGPQKEVLTVRVYEGKVGTYVMVWATSQTDSTGSAYAKTGAIQKAFESAGFAFSDTFEMNSYKDLKELVAKAAAAMGFPDCHIFDAHP